MTHAGRSPQPLTVALVGNMSSVHLQRWSSALVDRGHRVEPIDLAGRHRGPVARLIAWVRLRRSIMRVLRQPRSLVAIHYVPDGVLASGLRGLHPLVCSVWGADVTTEGSGIRARLRGWQLTGLVRAADAITATSHLLAETVERRFGVRADIVPFGVDMARFVPRHGPRRAGPVRFGFVKWLEPKYGPDVLVEAAGLLRDQLDFEVVIVGSGRLATRLAERTVELGLGDRIAMLGSRPHHEIPAILADLDVFVMPSRYEEFGVAAAEASAVGLPVIATRVGGIPEVVVDGETGILVAPEDSRALAQAMAELATDAPRRARYGAAGRRRVATLYDWDACVDRMISVYEKVTSGTRDPQRPAEPSR